jgi:hypothetical protein
MATKNLSVPSIFKPAPKSKPVTMPIMAAQSPMAGSTQLGCSDFAKIKNLTTTV